jgi:outer membrane protein TolC
MRHLHLFALTLLLPAAATAADGLAFGDAESEMLAANPQAASAALSLEAARARLDAARGELYPYVSADASYYRDGGSATGAYDNYSYGFSASQPLYVPALPAAVRSARASLWAAQAARDRVASSLRYQLATAFAGIINARETVALSSETLKRRADNLELIRLKYEAGRENKAALLETAALLKTAQWQHQKYLKDLRLAERGLNRLIGRPAQAPVPGLLLPRPPEPPEDFAAVAPRLEAHYTLSAARAAMASAQAAADTAQSAILPSLKAGAGYLWSGTSWPASPNSWNAGLKLSVPLFSGGGLSSSLGAARQALSAAEADYRNARDGVYLGAEDAFLGWREARAYLDVAKSSLDASNARAWLVRKQYLAGQSSYFEWRTVEEELISQKNQYLAAQLGLATAYAAFVQASGE